MVRDLKNTHLYELLITKFVANNSDSKLKHLTLEKNASNTCSNLDTTFNLTETLRLCLTHAYVLLTMGNFMHDKQMLCTSIVFEVLHKRQLSV